MDRERAERLEKIEELYLDLTDRMRALSRTLEEQAKSAHETEDTSGARSLLRVILKRIDEQESEAGLPTVWERTRCACGKVISTPPGRPIPVKCAECAYNEELAGELLDRALRGGQS